MKEKWIWLPDFASDMGLWEDDLVGISPDADHLFVSYEKMVSFLENFYDMPGLAEASTVVGWGFGAFVLLKNADKRPKNQKWILLAPYADYCSEHSEWNTENLAFIAHQTLTAVDATLNAFYELIENEFGEWQDDWMKTAKTMSPESMLKGLLYIAKTCIDAPVPITGETQVLYGRMDGAVPPAMTLELKEFLPGVEFKERPKAGHWPPMLLF
ncbi:alpha/beta fold hydrolase [Fibrobacter sp.]|uniref:alpha/beta fold hydrolase n=1 Tax=Fibrobacter sp. TaxID=35828 RepID=UPI00386A5687